MVKVSKEKTLFFIILFRFEIHNFALFLFLKSNG